MISPPVQKRQIAIVGTGPSGLFLFKRLLESELEPIEITLFESKNQLGKGMPYSSGGSGDEHVTNISDHETPSIVTNIADWIADAPQELLEKYQINTSNFNTDKVLPRLLFGAYLNSQFDLLLEVAESKNIATNVYVNTAVRDIVDDPEKRKVIVVTSQNRKMIFDDVIICIGHHWPVLHEGNIAGYFDSPYPPTKLKLRLSHPVAIKGSSLTAVDAIKTLARANGKFVKDESGQLRFELDKDSEGFKLILHSRNGLLPTVRFHLEDSYLHYDTLLTEHELSAHRAANDGFIALDFLFEHDFKAIIRSRDPDFYEKIKSLKLEDFVALVMDFRMNIDPFLLLATEYQEAEQSIKREQSIYWKEILAMLSFAMNQPAKYFSAEDMIRLQKVLMPLVSVVIAFLPQSSCKELMALRNAKLLDLVAVGETSKIIPQKTGGAIVDFIDDKGNRQHNHFSTFVDATGQPHLPFNSFPFHSLLDNKNISKARVRFADPKAAEDLIQNRSENIELGTDGKYYLVVPGLAINDNYQVIAENGEVNRRIYLMAVPYMGGFNPDYSGLDFGEAASAKVIEGIRAFMDRETANKKRTGHTTSTSSKFDADRSTKPRRTA